MASGRLLFRPPRMTGLRLHMAPTKGRRNTNAPAQVRQGGAAKPGSGRRAQRQSSVTCAGRPLSRGLRSPRGMRGNGRRSLANPRIRGGSSRHQIHSAPGPRQPPAPLNTGVVGPTLLLEEQQGAHHLTAPAGSGQSGRRKPGTRGAREPGSRRVGNGSRDGEAEAGSRDGQVEAGSRGGEAQARRRGGEACSGGGAGVSSRLRLLGLR